MHSLQLSRPLAFFDLETTGANISYDRIVQISILKAMPNGTHEQKTWLVNPKMPIPAEATKVHKITNEMIANEPEFGLIAPEIDFYLHNCDLAGFNIMRFDVPVLLEEFQRAGYDFDITERHMVDAQRIFHIMEPRNLSAAFAFYTGNTIDSLAGHAHSAETDTLATFMVLDEQIKRYANSEMEDENGNVFKPIQNDVTVLHKLSIGRNVDTSGRLYYNEQGVICFNFGKHKDRPVADVFKKFEPSYYSWMMSGDFPADLKKWITKIWNTVQSAGR